MRKAYMVSSVGSSGPSAKRLAVSLNRLLAPYRQRDRSHVLRALPYQLQHRAGAELSIPLTVRTAFEQRTLGQRPGVLLFGWNNQPECPLVGTSRQFAAMQQFGRFLG